MRLEFDLDSLTMQDAADLEEHAGVPIEDVAKRLKNKPPMKLIIVCLWIMERKRNPRFTLADTRNLKFSDIEFEDEAPTPKRLKPKSR